MKNMRYQLLKVGDAARKLCISPSTLYKWRGRKIPYIELGKSIRFLLSDIEAFIEKNRVVPQKDYQYDIKKIRLIKARMQKEKVRKILQKGSDLLNRGGNDV